MESDESQLKGPLEWFFMKAKVALAVAVIKSKPPGMSGRQYAEALASKLRRQDESWKNKAQGLQQEVLRLRQEMLITRVTSTTKSTTEAAGRPFCMYIGHDETMGDASQDLFGPGSEVYSADLQQGSDSETPDLLLHDPQPDIIFPPLLFPSSHHADPQGKAMLPHMQFLQSLCTLHRVGGSDKDLQSLWLGPDGDAGSVLMDTVCQLLDSVVAASRDPPLPGPYDLVLKACQVAARAMDLFCSQRLPSAEFMRRVEESLRELTGMLLHSNQPSRLRAAERLMECLITLGSSSMSKSLLIRHILSQINALADQLWQTFQGQESSGLDKFPVDQYQNSCHLFWIVEELLRKSKVPCRVEVGSEQTGFLSHLEQHVFLLSDEFPLFSIYMWRIGSLLTCSDR
ncbi:meiosis-specific protein MEI4 isoform X1 [Thunnus maccoyii]|uniref:meiosis-specific protein MEI4 isoform X1 n=1 Tax=Thunnus maccoyii TaxID=8240 RepID=UPI001C4D135A|nr:meiosis-specific protein MEI4 isoform X1 [Thunnus maccoyii]XP_042246714.1 meiosis-specific protein MEI4 isoform X1 [Thunnus maccoyii]XP_042246715.1 meiosis-specific protein MEI4 isoform X1 [Thunnus maccoyii]